MCISSDKDNYDKLKTYRKATTSCAAHDAPHASPEDLDPRQSLILPGGTAVLYIVITLSNFLRAGITRYCPAPTRCDGGLVDTERRLYTRHDESRTTETVGYADTTLERDYVGSADVDATQKRQSAW